MVADVYEAPDQVGSVLRREAGRWWWLPLVTGIAWLVVGWAVLRANVTSLKTVGVLVGLVFLGLALTEILLAWVFRSGWRVMHGLLAALFLLAAVWSFVRPVNTFFALASVLGLLVLVQGISYIVQGIGLRDQSPYWGFMLFGGVLMTGLGLWISTSDRVWTLAARSVFILVWVGFMAVFRGVQDVTIAFMLLHSSKQVDQPPSVSGEGRAAAVPPQRDPTSRPQTPVRPGS